MSGFFSHTRKRVAVVTLVGLVFVLAGAGLVAASSPDPAEHPRAADTGVAAVPRATGQVAGGGCRVGFDTQTATLVPPDDTTSDNVAASTVRLHKTCQGPVVGTFSSEVATPGAGDFVHVDMRATCVGTGRQTNPCTVGEEVFASPGHSFFQNGQASTHVGAVTMVWTGLKRGNWKFEVLPGGNGVANLQFRAFTVEAFGTS